MEFLNETFQMLNENRAFLFKIDSPLSYYFLSVWVCLVTFREYFPAKFCKLINCLNQGGKGDRVFAGSKRNYNHSILEFSLQIFESVADVKISGYVSYITVVLHLFVRNPPMMFAVTHSVILEIFSMVCFSWLMLSQQNCFWVNKF